MQHTNCRDNNPYARDHLHFITPCTYFFCLKRRSSKPPYDDPEKAPIVSSGNTSDISEKLPTPNSSTSSDEIVPARNDELKNAKLLMSSSTSCSVCGSEIVSGKDEKFNENQDTPCVPRKEKNVVKYKVMRCPICNNPKACHCGEILPTPNSSTSSDGVVQAWIDELAELFQQGGDHMSSSTSCIMSEVKMVPGKVKKFVYATIAAPPKVCAGIESPSSKISSSTEYEATIVERKEKTVMNNVIRISQELGNLKAGHCGEKSLTPSSSTQGAKIVGTPQ